MPIAAKSVGAVRLHLPARLRRRFRLAWAMVPPDAQANLAPVLRVRLLMFPFHPGNLGEYSIDRRVVYLHPSLTRGPRALVVAVALHELAHAADPLIGQRRLKDRDEAVACDMAAGWAAAIGTSFAQAVAPAMAGYRCGFAWTDGAPRWWSDDDRQEDAELRAIYEGDDGFDEVEP